MGMPEVRKADKLFLFAVLGGAAGSMLLSYMGISQFNYLLAVFFSQLVFFLPVLFAVVWEKRQDASYSITQQFRFRKIRPVTVFLVILFAVFVRPFLMLVNQVSMLFVANKTSEITSSLSESPFVLGLFVIGIVPAVLEELTYRGYYYQHYRKLGLLKGMLISGLIFGMMHLNFNQFAYAFVMGVLAALLMEVTDSVWPGMIVHFLVNGSSILITYLEPLIQKMAGNGQAEEIVSLTSVSGEEFQKLLLVSIRASIIPAFLGLLLAGMFLFQIAKTEGRNRLFAELVKKGNKKQNPGILFWLAAFLCLGLMILTEFP